MNKLWISRSSRKIVVTLCFISSNFVYFFIKNEIFSVWMLRQQARQLYWRWFHWDWFEIKIINFPSLNFLWSVVPMSWAGCVATHATLNMTFRQFHDDTPVVAMVQIKPSYPFLMISTVNAWLDRYDLWEIIWWESH